MNSQRRPCKNEIIMRLHLEGFSTAEIADEADTSIASVRATLSQMRRKGKLDGAAPRTTLSKTIGLLDTEVIRALRREAQKRKVKPSELAAMIIRTALRDGIVAAILDDKEPDT